MEDVRKQLLDLSRRNPLLNHKADRARNVEIFDEIAEEVYRMLVEEGKTLQFLSREEAGAGARAALVRLGVELAEENGSPGTDISRHTDRKLQTQFTSEKLTTRLLAIARDAKSHLEEQGHNTLYLTIGVVEWRASGEKEQASCKAPVLFVPAQLERKNANSRHVVSAFEDEILTNPCLVELARRDFQGGLPGFDEEAEGGLAEYLRKMESEVAKLPGWSFRREIHLGIFSFAKMLMWRDLDDRKWPAGKAITGHPLVRRLRGETVDGGATPTGEALTEELLDARVKPADCFHVMDADSSQHATIEAVKAGASLVVEGPPGTGKSQTITNMIAEAVAAEKTVLFVAEKAAALDVVKRRLEAAGLGDAVLALHSKNTHKGTVMGELRRVLENPPVGGAKGNGENAEALESVRDRLRAYREEVHRTVGGLSISVYEAVGETIRWGGEPEAACGLGQVLEWRTSTLDVAREQMEILGRRIVAVGDRAGHPWRGAGVEQVTLALRQALPALGERVVAAVIAVREAGRKVVEVLGLAMPATLAEAREQAAVGRVILLGPVMDATGAELLNAQLPGRLAAWQALMRRHAVEKGAWEKVLEDSAETAEWRAWLERRKRAGMLRWLRKEWRADTRTLRGHVKKGMAVIREQEERMIRAVTTSAATRAEIEREGAALAGVLGGAWTGWASDRVVLDGAVRRVLDVWDVMARGAVGREAVVRLLTGDRTAPREAVGAAGATGEELSVEWAEFSKACVSTDEAWFGRAMAAEAFDRVAQTVNAAVEDIDRLEAWADLNAATAAARRGPAAAFVAWAFSPQGAPGGLAGAFLRQFYRAWVEAALEALPTVRAWRGEDYAALAARFRALDRAWIEATRRRVRALVESRRPDIAGRTARQSELGLIKAELRKKKRFMPLRKLLAEAGGAVQQIKPCFMMSPISVAQYLTPGAMEFDLVIFDEASQVEPADAFGAIGRGRQLVLVGDEKQLPPTSFFAREESADATDEAEGSLSDVESVLGLGFARLGQSRQLRWHYRSRHASLIAFSNDHFYQGSLRVFPSPHTDTRELGLRFRHVEGGVYKRGAGRTNEIEAQAVAEAVLTHARATPELSLGVGALNRPQADAISDALEELRRKKENEGLEAFFDDKRAEPFIVRNLENIQGDERDVMFLSVGYGRDAAGKITANFGALNADGGWRRLNVFATRARRRCEVFSSIHADEIKLTHGAPRGVVAFKEYLHVAEHGKPAEAPVPMKDHDSPFEEDVCRALRQRGWEVHAQVGSAGFFVDLAVVDARRPGRYLLGIECDGEVYHRTPTARDRDRIRQEVLEGLGWTIHRIWSSDWFRRKPEALQKVVARLESLSRQVNIAAQESHSEITRPC